MKKMMSSSEKARFLIIALLVTSLAAIGDGCSDEKTTKTAALPDGTYRVSRPVCTDTGKNLNYNSEVQPAVLRDYLDTDAVEITIAGADVTAIVKDADCELMNKQIVLFNSGSVVSFAKQTTNTWTPDGCKMSVEVNGEKSDIDKDLVTSTGSKVFADVTSMEQGGSFDIIASGDVYTLTFGIAINDFGCTNGAKFQWTWTKKS